MISRALIERVEESKELDQCLEKILHYCPNHTTWGKVQQDAIVDTLGVLGKIRKKYSYEVYRQFESLYEQLILDVIGGNYDKETPV